MEYSSINSLNSTIAERRRYRRAIVKRRVFLADLNGHAPLIEGYALDLSPGGLRISSAFELPTGLAVEVEVFESEDIFDAPALMVRGIITWSMPDTTRNTVFLSGIRIAMRLSTRSILQPLRNYEAAQGAIKNFKAAVLPSSYIKPLSLHYASEQQESTYKQPVWVSLYKNKKYYLWLFILLILLFQLYAVSILENTSDNITVGSYWKSIRENISDADQTYYFSSMLIGRRERSELTNEVRPQSTSAMNLINRAEYALEGAHPGSALDYFREIESMNSVSTMETYLGRLGEARALYALGNAHSALIVLDELQNSTGKKTHAVWQDLSREVSDNIANNSNSDLMPALSEILPLIPLTEIDAYVYNNQSKPERRIEIITSGYVLHLIESDTVVATFPVGLGIDDSTPLGKFEVVNLIKEPDWYDRREDRVVLQGDPENPLGDHWIGLGKGTTATPYGIHPTIEPESIGSNLSRGCIRMRPEDAAKVFAWCEIGAPVLIK